MKFFTDFYINIIGAYSISYINFKLTVIYILYNNTVIISVNIYFYIRQTFFRLNFKWGGEVRLFIIRVLLLPEILTTAFIFLSISIILFFPAESILLILKENFIQKNFIIILLETFFIEKNLSIILLFNNLRKSFNTCSYCIFISICIIKPQSINIFRFYIERVPGDKCYFLCNCFIKKLKDICPFF